jgi:hypothetical protein
MQKPSVLHLQNTEVIPAADHDAVLVGPLHLHIVKRLPLAAQPHARSIPTVRQEAVAAVLRFVILQIQRLHRSDLGKLELGAVRQQLRIQYSDDVAAVLQGKLAGMQGYQKDGAACGVGPGPFSAESEIQLLFRSILIQYDDFPLKTAVRAGCRTVSGGIESFSFHPSHLPFLPEQPGQLGDEAQTGIVRHGLECGADIGFHRLQRLISNLDDVHLAHGHFPVRNAETHDIAVIHACGNEDRAGNALDFQIAGSGQMRRLQKAEREDEIVKLAGV